MSGPVTSHEGPRVLHLRGAFGGGGGADSVIYDLTRKCNAIGVAATVGYLRKRDDSSEFLLSRLHAVGVPAIDLRGRAVFDTGQFRDCMRTIRQGRIQILHCHDTKSVIYGVLLHRFFPDARLVSTMHGWSHQSPRGRIYTALAQHALRRHFHAIVAVSEHTLQLAFHHRIRNVRLIHNGIDTDVWPCPPRAADDARAGIGDTTAVVGFVGRLSPEKGPLDFVRVAACLHKMAPGMRFRVAGEGPQRAIMESLARELGLGTCMEFLGFVAPDRLRDIYAGLNVLVLPSHSEGLPLTILEAWASGVCVVASRVGGVPELIEDGVCGLLADAGDVSGFARQVLALHDQPGLADRLRREARRLVETQWSLDTMVSQYKALYLQVLEGGRGASAPARKNRVSRPADAARGAP